MKRVWKERPTVRRERTWIEVLPLDPRDPDVVRAKALGAACFSGARHATQQVLDRAVDRPKTVFPGTARTG